MAAWDHWAFVGDPPADRVVASLRGAPRGVDRLQQVERLADSGVRSCQDFIGIARDVPAWVDFEQAEHGARVYLANVRMAMVAFVLGSQIVTYSAPSIARLLVSTGRLRQAPVRRLYETASMVRAVLRPAGLRPAGPGWRAVLSVRLLHAMIRQAVPRGPAGEQPINQLDMALTATTYSHVIVRGLKRFGVTVSDDEARACQHQWRYAAHLMGVVPALQGDGPGGEQAAHERLKAMIVAPDQNSRCLTSALHAALHWQPPLRLPRAVAEALSWRLLDADVAAACGVRPRAQVSPAMLKGLNRVAEVASVIRTEDDYARAGSRYFDRVMRAGLQ